MLVDPGVIARLGAVLADAFEAGAGILIDGPALGAMIAGGSRPIERTLTLPAVEAAEMAARHRRPDHAVFVDIAAPVSSRQITGESYHSRAFSHRLGHFQTSVCVMVRSGSAL